MAHRRPSRETIPMSIRLPADIRADLESVSRQRDVSVSWIIVEVLRRWQLERSKFKESVAKPAKPAKAAKLPVIDEDV